MQETLSIRYRERGGPVISESGPIVSLARSCFEIARKARRSGHEESAAKHVVQVLSNQIYGDPLLLGEVFQVRMSIFDLYIGYDKEGHESVLRIDSKIEDNNISVILYSQTSRFYTIVFAINGEQKLELDVDEILLVHNLLENIKIYLRFIEQANMNKVGASYNN